MDGAQGGQRLGQQVRVPLGEGAAEDPFREQQEVPPVLARAHKLKPWGERSLGGTRGRGRVGGEGERVARSLGGLLPKGEQSTREVKGGMDTEVCDKALGDKIRFER